MKKLAAAVALTGATALISPALALPAHAATVTVHDKVGDEKHGGGHGDIKYVRVHYGPDRLKFRIQWSPNATPEDFQDIFIDTDPKNPGPEVEISLSAETEQWGGSLVDDWSGKPTKSIRGGGKFRYGTVGNSEFVKFSVRRSFVRRKGHAQPKRIRVSVNDVFETDEVWDSAPGHKKWSRWIRWK